MFRTIFSKIVQNGRQILGEILQKQAPKETKEVFRIGLENQSKLSNVVVPQAARLGRHGESVLSRYLARSVTRNLAGEMRRKFALRSQAGSWSIFGGARIQGSRLSLYAFVGVGLAARNQQWQRTESEGFDSVCDQIRGMFKDPSAGRQEDSGDIGTGRTLEDFDIGSLIAKGCNAAVYEAKLRREVVDTVSEETEVTPGEQQQNIVTDADPTPEMEDDVVNSTTSESPEISRNTTTSPAVESDLQSWASSIEILAEEEIACTTEFDPGGHGTDLKWRFQIVPLEGDPVAPSDTGWSDSDVELIDGCSIEVITDSDVVLNGIPFVMLEKSDADELQLGPASSEQGAMLIGEWDIRLEDAVNLSESVNSNLGLNLLNDLSVHQNPLERNTVANFTDTAESMNHADLEIENLNPEILAPVAPPIPAGLERSALDNQDLKSLDSLQMDTDYNLAIKMMFNYDAESNAPSILRTMAKELVPAKLASIHNSSDMVEISRHWKKKDLPAHPNIVEMNGVFVDSFPHLPDAWDEYPNAMPERLNPGHGFGRNQTMFLVMKRYPMTLREYLESNTPSVKESTQLLTQLVEGVVHMNQHGIAHRDLKSDNILVEVTENVPHLVVSDFGCCTTEGLRVPFNTLEVDRGGNGSLMAPEISKAEPGMFRYLDYSKSDLWAAGAIAYEIFGTGNPFYRNESGSRLDSRTYSEQDLPSFPDAVPQSIQHIIHLMLKKDVPKRPSPIRVANLLQLIQWAPEEWTSPSSLPSTTEVKRWLLTLTAEVVCQRLGEGHSSGNAEHQLKSLFLSRVDLDDIRSALSELV